MNVKELENKVRELRQVQALIAEAEAEAEALKDIIKAELGDRDELLVGEYKISWKEVRSNRLDAAALKKALPEVAERFSKEVVARRFLVA